MVTYLFVRRIVIGEYSRPEGAWCTTLGNLWKLGPDIEIICLRQLRSKLRLRLRKPGQIFCLTI